MLTAALENDKSNNYQRYYLLTDLNEEMLRQANETFDEYRARGVVLNEGFLSDEWVITNQVNRTTLKFLPNELFFKQHAENWLGCSYRHFVDGLKTYTVFNFGELSIRGIKEIVSTLVRSVEEPCERISADKHLIEFLKLLPGGETKDRVIENLEEQLYFQRQQQTLKRQRVLADFTSYFDFNNALEGFWSNANENDKLFFFPLYFWWNLTAILPLRPTEFLLTPRQCLEVKNGENILTIRRTALKGRHGKVHYNIEGDYKLMKYPIPEEMASAIAGYIKATAKLPLSSLNTLFAPQAHYSYLGRSIPPSSVYYSYQNLSYCLRKFQSDIMKIAPDRDSVNLGDTRHLAMISLIVSGGSPTICKELADHEDIAISSNYYSNISEFIKCATYEMSKKSVRNNSVDLHSHRAFRISETVAVIGGRCDSSAYISGSINDCIRSIGLDGELGHCVSCPHFIDGKTGKHLLFSDANIDALKSKVDADSKYLIRLLEVVRKGRGCSEDIQAALLRLQHSSANYSHILYRNMGGS
jgi:hypothetical protein